MSLEPMTPAATHTTVHVTSPSGRRTGIPEGHRLVFGRGPDTDLEISVGRGLSRRAGVIAALGGGAWVANISLTHALYAHSDGHRVRLPPMEEAGEPRGGWYVRSGAVLVGSRTMLDEGLSLRVEVAAAFDAVPADLSEPTDPDGLTDPDGPGGDSTLLPLTLDPMTKLFLVALLWCRPWLIDPTRTTPLPRTPEIARAALEVTDGFAELFRFDHDPDFRDLLAARVGEHIKVLRRRITDRGLVRARSRLSDEVVVEVLIENGVIAPAHLAYLDDPEWRSRHEDLWWTSRPHPGTGSR